ncbi:beta-hydroxyacyl-acyl carrier protein dehydratase (FABZ) [Cardiosporidium cionae]|uniref:Beta-hydroxyacyl-acyl carrier protein dehydratase (FABZ) n=1 Tax=Cardiosporidium cionae TaxID=476202 RepID=A0ABQ7JFV8_9APIC|nr:beta-hydroxyacyl-acyl carrier protein dehydratase (FABZ) [Cardiosporidium cionae]|eukprot:KAF8822892.1 beta-hydroxyacyl-acyl carrier protein dehydratase (FABZ) [Cardiosporidium cionae]
MYYFAPKPSSNYHLRHLYYATSRSYKETMELTFVCFLSMILFCSSLPSIAALHTKTLGFVPTISVKEAIPQPNGGASVPLQQRFKRSCLARYCDANPSIAQEWKSAQQISSRTKDAGDVPFSYDEIKKILPHRFPFLLIDKILQFEPGKRAVGLKQISGNEDQFNGHFPDRAVMPGVLQIEALAQLGGIVCLQQPVSDGKGDFFFAGIDGVRWRKPVLPGDSLILETNLLVWKPRFGIAKMDGRGYVDGELVLSVKELTFALVK